MSTGPLSPLAPRTRRARAVARVLLATPARLVAHAPARPARFARQPYPGPHGGGTRWT